MNHRWTRWGVALVATMLLAWPAAADRTKLLEVDLRTGKRRDIDGGKPKTAADRSLDAMLDSATGGSAFSTDELAKVEHALRRFLHAARPRAMPRMLLFLYPGRISRGRLKELREVLVDIELVIDPCGRAVCRTSVARTLELVGRSLKQAVIRTRKYTVRFQTVTVQAVPDIRGSSPTTYRFDAKEVVRAGHTGGARKLLDRLDRATKGYAAMMTKLVAQRVKRRRVSLRGVPKVERSGGKVTVTLNISSDRNRYRTHVAQAMAGAADALSKSPLTPPQTKLVVVAAIRFRRMERRTFSSMGRPVARHVAGELSRAQLWSDYITEHKKGGTQLSFSDSEASSGVGGGGGTLDQERVRQILSNHFSTLAPCLQREASRNRRFRGVTLRFAVTGSGRASQIKTKETVSGSLRGCLRRALSKIPFPRHQGAPRRVDYPMYIQR